VTLAVIGRALEAIPQEMGINMLKAAYSSIVREAKDMSAALFDGQCQVIGQAEHIPTLLSALSTALVGARDAVGWDGLAADEAIITNDPYHGAQHLNDICLFTPVFHRDRLVGFSASVAHHLDIGGVAPGIIPNATEIYQEGLRFPPMRVRLEHGRLPALLREIIEANVRVPRDTVGDLSAQIVANFTGRQRFLELIERYGIALTEQAIVEILDRTERLTRATIARFPQGSCTGEAFLDDNGVDGRRLRVAVRVEVRGDELLLDFSDSDPQVGSMLNCDRSSATAAAWTAIRHVVLTRVSIPNNAGCYRPIRLIMPEGSCLNPRSPGSIHGRILSAYRVYDAVMLALSQIVPEQVIATGNNSSTNIALTKITDGKYRILSEVVAGGWGASAHADGPEALPFPLSNCSNPPAEYVEAEFDFLRVLAYRMVPDSGGAGWRRGGLGEERLYEILADDVEFTVFTDRHAYPPPGLFGGLPGLPGRIERIRGGQATVLPSRSRARLMRGDLLRVIGGGGGGYGDPAGRDPGLLAADLRSGRLSDAEARRAYPLPAASG
jgi:N-methylhydantoinase B